MRILKNQAVLQRQNENYIRGELSNIASVIATPQILVEYFSVDADQSTTMHGFKNVEDYLGEHSPLLFSRIDNLPMAGIDSLVEQATWDEEFAFEEDIETGGVILPNTIIPKPHDMFRIPSSQVDALYIVTNIEPVTVRSNPFVGIRFKLLTRDPDTIQKIYKQVIREMTTTVTAIGADKSLVIQKTSYLDIQHHVEQYLDLCNLYKTLFWDDLRSAFIFDGCMGPIDPENPDMGSGAASATDNPNDPNNQRRWRFVDFTLWKMMFDEGIIIYDDVITYANNNFKRTVPRIYASCPDSLVDDYHYKRSILWRLYDRDQKHPFDEFRFPQSVSWDTRISKYNGVDLIYFESYGDQCDCNLMCMTCPVWDEEFMCRIRNNDPYPVSDEPEFCMGCNLHCLRKHHSDRMPQPRLRNALISWYNTGEVDWDNLEITDDRSSENYFIIPILLGAYKKFIHDLQS